MSSCSFCGERIEKGTGKMFVKSDGTINFFCSRKCEKNAEMRDSKKVRWTNDYVKLKKRRHKSLTKGKK